MKKIKKKYIVLVVAALVYYVWTIPPVEVRPILEASKIVQNEYEQSIKQAVLDGKKEVYLKDVVKSVEWDMVCLVAGYRVPIREETFRKTGVDFQLLNYWGDTCEECYALVFIGKNRLISVIERDIYEFPYESDSSIVKCLENNNKTAKKIFNQNEVR